MSIYKVWLGCILAMFALYGCSQKSSSTASSNAVFAASTVQASARGIIEIEGGLLALPALISGQVQHIDVKPGSLVTAGQILLTIANHDLLVQLQNTRQEQKIYQTQQRLMDQQIALLQHRFDVQKQALRQGVGSASAVDDAQAVLLTAKQQKQNNALSLEQLLGKTQLLQAEISRLTLRAPLAGRIDQIHVQVGNWVQKSDTELIRMIPHHSLVIHAEVNEAFINRIHAGEQAQVHLETIDSAQVFKAHVIYVGATMERSRLADNAQMSNDFPCYLALDPQQWADAHSTFHIGQTVRVNFL